MQVRWNKTWNWYKTYWYEVWSCGGVGQWGVEVRKYYIDNVGGMGEREGKGYFRHYSEHYSANRNRRASYHRFKSRYKYCKIIWKHPSKRSVTFMYVVFLACTEHTRTSDVNNSVSENLSPRCYYIHMDNTRTCTVARTIHKQVLGVTGLPLLVFVW